MPTKRSTKKRLPKPYYEDDAVTIYHGDCREILPELGPVDLVLTDPPYGIAGGRGGGNLARGKGEYQPNGWEDTPCYIESVCVPVIEWAIEHVGRVVLTPGQNHLRDYPKPTTIGAFWVPADVGFTSWGRNTWTPILYYGRDPRAGINQVPSGRMMTETASIKGHPCAKPIEPWKWLLAKASLEGETILDPFMGSGTTLRAAKDLGRKAIGIEIEERYCEIAVRRLKQRSLGIIAPTPPKRKRKQTGGLFDG